MRPVSERLIVQLINERLLRLPLLHLGSLRIALVPRYLALSHLLSCSLSARFQGKEDDPSAPGRFCMPVCLSRFLTQGDNGPLEVPGYPCVRMPRS